MATEFISDAPGCFTQLKDSFAKVGGGILMIIIAFPLLFWNEGRAVKRAQDLEFGKGAVVSVDSSSLDPSKAGSLVHTSGTLKVNQPVVDSFFKIEVNAMGLSRNVEMFQWKERTSKKKKKIKTSYEKTWSTSGINSENFKKTKFHNPAFPNFKNKSVYAKDVSLGVYKLDMALVKQWSINESYILKAAALTKIAKVNGFAPQIDGEYVYFGNPSDPQVGDIRVSFKIGKTGEASTVSGLTKNTLNAFSNSEMNNSIALISPGIKSSESMFQAAEEANEMMTWILRLVGFFFLFMGFNLLFGPLDTLFRVIPFLGPVFDFGTTLIAGLLAFGLSFITISVGWIFYRPLIGIPLLLLGVASIVGLFVLALKAGKKRTTT